MPDHTDILINGLKEIAKTREWELPSRSTGVAEVDAVDTVYQMEKLALVKKIGNLANAFLLDYYEAISQDAENNSSILPT